MHLTVLIPFALPPMPKLAAGSELHLDEAAAAPLLEKGLVAEVPDLPQLKARMLDIWDTLPVEVRAAFRPLKTAVLDAINDNCLDEVALLIAAAEVPTEYAEAKKALTALLG